MIELSVSLASNGVVKVPGYEQLVRFGYTKNRGVYRLHVDATGEWEGLTIRCFWHVPDGKDPASSLVVDGYVDVPASVTAQPGSGCITFEGSDGTKTVTSADLRYRVAANSGTEDGTEPEPGSPAWQQLVDAVHTVATTAEQAKTDAQTAAQQADVSAKKAGNALSDTITAKEDALKAIGDKQTTATQAVDTARDKALQQVEASTKAAQTAASEAATSAGSASQSAQEAADSLKELKDGIASGNFKGEKGDKGDTGKDAPQIDDTTVTDSAPWSSKHIVDMLCPPLEETGNPVQCYPVEGYPLGCKVSWEPVQEGTGTPSPDNVRPIKGKDSVTVERCGENLLDSVPELPIRIYKDPPSVVVRGGTIPAGQYTMDVRLDVIPGGEALGAALIKYDLSDGTEKYFVPRASNETSVTTTFETAIKEIAVVNYGNIDGNITGISLVPGATAGGFEPYTGQTATLTLPHTIYGGTVDAVTGEGRERWKLVTLAGTERIYKRDRFDLFEINLVLPVSVLTSAAVASHWSGTRTANTNALYAENRNINVGLNTCGFDTVDDLASYLSAQYAAGTPVQIAYKLATPTPFTATGAQPITALSGVNTVLTDADSATITGRADPIKRITDLEDAVASMTTT